MKKNLLKGTVLQFLVLLGLWLLLSGHYDAFHIGAGVFSALLVTLMHVRINRYLYEEMSISHAASMRYARLALYVPWLL